MDSYKKTMQIIESVHNPKVKEWTKLQQKKYRQQNQQFLVEGEHLVEEAMKTNCAQIIITTREVFETDLPVYQVTPAILEKLSATPSPQDVMAICQMVTVEPSRVNRILLLDAIQDPGNLGTLIRSAVAFNVEAIVLGKGTVDLYNEKVLRSTQGAVFHVPVMQADLASYIPELQKQGVEVIGTSLQQAVELQSFEIPKRWALLLGNEGQGVNQQLLDLTDENVFIEMMEQAESLNVAIAGSIVMYTLMNR
ncbi:MAG: TrmH family RNA methyltransferase [Culicoidibacterales bacterium]